MGWLRFMLWRARRKLKSLSKNPTTKKFADFHDFIENKKGEFEAIKETFAHYRSDAPLIQEKVESISEEFKEILFMKGEIEGLRERAVQGQLKSYKKSLDNLEEVLNFAKPRLSHTKNIREFLK